jgi:uncharacterized protein (UPF0261 family)
MLLPLQGVSALDRAGQPFDDPLARAALFESLRRHRTQTQLVEIDCHMNAPPFAEAAANHLLRLLSAHQESRATKRSG